MRRSSSPHMALANSNKNLNNSYSFSRWECKSKKPYPSIQEDRNLFIATKKTGCLSNFKSIRNSLFHRWSSLNILLKNKLLKGDPAKREG